VTREQLLQRAGLPVLNGGGAAAAVPPFSVSKDHNIMDLLQRKHHEISSETGIWHMTCYILNIVSHSNLLLNAIYVWSSEALLYRSLVTPKLIVDVVGEL